MASSKVQKLIDDSVQTADKTWTFYPNNADGQICQIQADWSAAAGTLDGTLAIKGYMFSGLKPVSVTTMTMDTAASPDEAESVTFTVPMRKVEVVFTANNITTAKFNAYGYGFKES